MKDPERGTGDSQRQAAIVAAATELMAEAGYAAMSMRKLATRVGLQPGSLYAHVTSKQDLLVYVLADIIDQRDQAWRNFPRRPGIIGGLRTGIEFLLERQRSHPHEVRLLEWERVHLDPAQQRWLIARPDRMKQDLVELLRRGRAQGIVFPDDATHTVAAMIALVRVADAQPLDAEWEREAVERHVLSSVARLLGIKRVQLIEA